MVAPAERSRNSYPSAHDGEERQDRERNQHYSRTLMNSMPVCQGRPGPRRGFFPNNRMFGPGSAIFSKKCQKPKPEHVERSKKRGDNPDQPVDPARLVCPPENFIFAEEACQGRDSGNGEGPECHCPERPGNLFTQAAHLTHVLLAADGVNH